MATATIGIPLGVLMGRKRNIDGVPSFFSSLAQYINNESIF
jgi:hypothetical protein